MFLKKNKSINQPSYSLEKILLIFLYQLPVIHNMPFLKSEDY